MRYRIHADVETELKRSVSLGIHDPLTAVQYLKLTEQTVDSAPELRAQDRAHLKRRLHPEITRLQAQYEREDAEYRALTRCGIKLTELSGP